MNSSQTTDDPTRCRACGAVLNGSRLDGLCPACTWGSLLEVEGDEFEPPTPSGPSKGLFQFPGHVVCEEIARGGMGIVYRARQAEPAREVALKMLLPHQLGSAEMRERFRLEVRAIAGLEHPAILPVYQVGEHDGLPYFTMKLATGGTLASRAQRYRGKFRQIAELMVTLVEAVHFAHERGVLHRDLKPGNILFDEADRPYVSDFGLAKFTELAGGDTPTLTRSIQLLGTPQFLPPEIAGGSVSSATTAGDIYSLGAVLYELLTGAPPFVGENLTTLLKAIVEHEPVRPSKLVPVIPRDLEVICLKCLAKEPSRRYASARELAEDLRRWRAGRTILARPATRFERARAWSRRNPALAIVGTALMLALAGGVILQSVNNRRLQFALAESLLAQARLERSSGRAGQRFGTLSLVARAAKNVRSLWGEAPAVTVTALRSEVAAALALPDVRALARWPVHIAHFENEFDFTANLDRYVTAALDGGFTLFSTAEQRLLWHVTGVATNSAVELRISSDGRWAGANYQDGHVELHSLSTRQPPRRWPGERNALTHFAFAPSGDCFAVATPNSDGAQSVEVLQLQTGVVIHVRLTGGPAMAMAFDRTGTHLATAGTDLVVWRLADAHKLWSTPLPHSASAVAWSPDGHGLAVALDRRLGEATLAFKGEPVLLFDALNGRQQTVLAEAATRVERLAFHPDGDSLVAATWHGELLWVSVRTDGFRLTAPGAQRALRFAPGGKQLAYAPSKDELGLLEVATPSALHQWRSSSPPAQESFTMAVSTNGRWVLTGTDNAVQLWDADARSEMASLPLPAKAWWVQVLFGPGDEFFYYSGASFGVRRVELARTNGPDGRFRLQFGREQLLGEPTGFIATGFAADGCSLLVGQNRRRTQNETLPPTIWLWPEGDPTRARKLAENFPLVGLRAVPRGPWGVSTDLIEPDLWVWNVATGERVRSLGIALPTSSEPAPNGRWLVTKTRAELAVWEVGTWRKIAHWPTRQTDQGTRWLVASPDSRLLVASAAEGRLTLRALPSGEELTALPLPRAMRLADWRFSPDGSRLFVLPSMGQVFEWDLAELRRELAKLNLDWQDSR